MNEVIQSLVELAEKDPLPVLHTSSHWLHYGQGIVVRQSGDRLILQGSGFTSWSRANSVGKVLHWVERQSYARVTSQFESFRSVWKTAKKLARDLGVSLTRHEWASAVVVALLQDHFRQHGLAPRTFTVIGDGDGFLGALILRSLASGAARMYCIDLPVVLIFQAQTHEIASPQAAMSVFSGDARRDRRGGNEVVFVRPNDIAGVVDEIECAVSFVSMQEMNASSIGSYFSFLRRRSTPTSRFYCVARLRKELLGGEVASFIDYPWESRDEVFLDGPCPYLSYFFDRHQYPCGPRLCGRRVPFVNHWDGPLWHRLVHLTSKT